MIAIEGKEDFVKPMNPLEIDTIVGVIIFAAILYWIYISVTGNLNTAPGRLLKS